MFLIIVPFFHIIVWNVQMQNFRAFFLHFEYFFHFSSFTSFPKLYFTIWKEEELKKIRKDWRNCCALCRFFNFPSAVARGKINECKWVKTPQCNSFISFSMPYEKISFLMKEQKNGVDIFMSLNWKSRRLWIKWDAYVHYFNLLITILSHL